MRASAACLAVLLSVSSANALPRMELRAAVEAKVVVATASGNGIDAVRLTLTAKRAIALSIPAGTFFDTPKGAGHQRMVVTRGVEVTLEAGAAREVGVKTACANFHLRVPRPQDTFVIGEAPEELAHLVRCLEKKKVDDHERQITIWKHTDNIDRSQLEKRPHMLRSLLIRKCALASGSRRRCEELARKGMKRAREKLLERAPELIDECKGVGRPERKRDKLKRLLKRRD